MLSKNLILGFTLLSTALAASTDLDICGKTCLSIGIARIGCKLTDVSCICTMDSEGKLGKALDDCLSATPGCSDAELAAANEGRVVGLLSYFCSSTAPSASLALISAGAFTTTATSLATASGSTTGGLTSQISTTQASTATAGSLTAPLGATTSGATTTTAASSPSSSASSTATPSKSLSDGLVEKAKLGILAAVPFAFAAIGGAFALTA